MCVVPQIEEVTPSIAIGAAHCAYSVCIDLPGRTITGFNLGRRRRECELGHGC
jgi:hypothetical protein